MTARASDSMILCASQIVFYNYDYDYDMKLKQPPPPNLLRHYLGSAWRIWTVKICGSLFSRVYLRTSDHSRVTVKVRVMVIVGN